MTIAKKQSVAGVTRATQALVERFRNDVKKDLQTVISKVTQLQIRCHGNSRALKVLQRKTQRILQKSIVLKSRRLNGMHGSQRRSLPFTNNTFAQRREKIAEDGIESILN